MKCIKCGADLPESALFCPACGKKQTYTKQNRTKRGNGLGTVYKRGNTWTAEITLGYKREEEQLKRIVRKKGGFRTKKDALEYIPALRATEDKNKSITWQQLYDLWLPTHRAGKDTLNCYKAAEKYFDDISYRKLSQIDIDDLQECIDDCPKGKRTKENMKALAGLMYKYAVPRDYAKLNLAQYLIVSGDSGQSRISFNAEQLEKIHNAVGKVEYADYIYCMCYLGFRPSEFLALDAKDYDRKEKALRGGAKTEAGKNRVVTISPKIQPIIDQLTKNKISGPIFCAENGNAISYTTFRDNYFYPALQKIGIENPVVNGRHLYSPHSCRHTFATLMKAVQAPDKDKMELIGHASPEMLRYYQDVDIEDIRKITNIL